MPNEIKSKFGNPTAITITLASLASSTSGVGRQGTIIDNTSDRFFKVEVTASIKLGTSPSTNTAVYIYLIRSDNSGSNHRTDQAGTSDAALTVVNAQVIGILGKASPSTGDVLSDSWTVEDPGPKWTVAVVNSSGASLDSTGGNHYVGFVGINPEVQ